ncbi:hypothetical protein [Bradyrhizobium japonicum]|uniref:hypothetical protein n=1 Tax=Bradyrhizobium japonicum TaxID=375 RepID=UPI00041DC1FE|nr:hypothetical protein [Bradyrhizobium japonicum]
MPSPNDNFLLKDGNDNPFELRAKDVSSLQDGSLQIVRHLSTLYPVDYGIGGCFHRLVRSGSMGAGLTSNSPILAFRNPSSNLNALIRRVRLNAWSLSTGFTTGLATFEMYVARGFSVQDTAGTAETMTTPQGKLAASMSGSACLIQRASTGALTAGTRTLDSVPLDAHNGAAPTSTNTQFAGLPVKIFEKLGSDHPLLLTQNEGFVLQATVPATGVWAWSAAIEWDEVPPVNF